MGARHPSVRARFWLGDSANPLASFRARSSELQAGTMRRAATERTGFDLGPRPHLPISNSHSEEMFAKVVLVFADRSLYFALGGQHKSIAVVRQVSYGPHAPQ